MKILIVRTFPNEIDPKQYNMQEIGLAKALTKCGHTCGIVLYYGKHKDTFEKLSVATKNGEEAGEITVYRLHAFGILKNGFFPALKKIANQYDVIQVHEYDQITSWWYYSFSKKPVVIYHGPYYHSFNKGYNLKCRIFDHTFLKLRLKEDTVCLTKSQAAAQFLRKKGFLYTEPVGVGLDTDNFSMHEEKTDLPDDLIISPDLFYLCYVGKMEERRNVYFLLNLLEKVSKRDIHIRMIIIGNGEPEYTKAFLEKAKPFIQIGLLQYRNSMNQQQLAVLYQRMQLMVFPTNYDIFGMVLLEALFFGLPVISSKNGGADMMLDNNKYGEMLLSFDTEEWVKTILKWKRMIEAGVVNREQNLDLTWDAIAPRFIQGYEKAIELKQNNNKR